jgi:hypothetical protein
MSDNMRIWRAVEKTNPAHTKHVNQRGGFTAVSAQYQILAATEQFGPIGEGWGYTTGDPIVIDTLITVPVTLWHGKRENTFGPMLGCEEWKDKNGRLDSDAPKKAVTDGLTKLLSQLGFNADVFLGRFDDSKYVEQMKREFAEPKKPEKPAPDINSAITPEQITWLQSRCDAAGISAREVCDKFNVESFKQLVFGQLTEAKAWLAEKKKAA